MTDTPRDERYQRIWQVVAEIPEGCVLSYGEVARLAGLPGRARMVGQALGRAPVRMDLPWHRVINAQGRISFKRGSRPYRKQRDLLESEGVLFVDGSVDLDHYGPGQVLDRLLWGPIQSD